MRAFIGFLLAPGIPALLLWAAQSIGSVPEPWIFPFMLATLGYLAALIVGIPTHLVLRRKGVRTLTAYFVFGTVIGATFAVLFEILTSYQGQLLLRLQHSAGELLVAAAYAALASTVFWFIAVRRVLNNDNAGTSKSQFRT